MGQFSLSFIPNSIFNTFLLQSVLKATIFHFTIYLLCISKFICYDCYKCCVLAISTGAVLCRQILSPTGIAMNV